MIYSLIKHLLTAKKEKMSNGPIKVSMPHGYQLPNNKFWGIVKSAEKQSGGSFGPICGGVASYENNATNGRGDFTVVYNSHSDPKSRGQR